MMLLLSITIDKKFDNNRKLTEKLTNYKSKAEIKK
jgi:hypothetical protein